MDGAVKRDPIAAAKKHTAMQNINKPNLRLFEI
jgi:hypothetical protein